MWKFWMFGFRFTCERVKRYRVEIGFQVDADDLHIVEAFNSYSKAMRFCAAKVSETADAHVNVQVFGQIRDIALDEVPFHGSHCVCEETQLVRVGGFVNSRSFRR